MFMIIAFLGGMISLLSPCTLPVIPLLLRRLSGAAQTHSGASGGNDCDVHVGGDGSNGCQRVDR